MSERARNMFDDVIGARKAADRLAGARTGLLVEPGPAPGVTGGDTDTTSDTTATNHDAASVDDTATDQARGPAAEPDPSDGHDNPPGTAVAEAPARAANTTAERAPRLTKAVAAGERQSAAADIGAPRTGGGARTTDGPLVNAPRLILPGVERVRVSYLMPSALLIGLRREQSAKRVRGRRSGGNNEIGEMICEHIPTDLAELATEIVNLETRADLTGPTLLLACTIPADVHDAHGDLLLSLLEHYRINATRRLLWIVGADRRLRANARRS